MIDKTWLMYKNAGNLKKFLSIMPYLHTNCYLKIIKLKVDPNTRDKWSTYGPKQHEQKQFLSLEHSCCLSLV